MIEKNLRLTSASGLHARPCAQLADLAQKCGGTVGIRFGSQAADLKNVMRVMSLGIQKDSEVTLYADGADEENALKQIAEFIETLP